jgi:succinate dehydrogenase/fumarate reductase flavoprotein subunit
VEVIQTDVVIIAGGGAGLRFHGFAAAGTLAAASLLLAS